ncbi:MAG TPA: hypothetical protein VK689_01400, partial [Armatimonadota bacterium]|nr:hypothetical protein [Armatimonadota bacterium]
LALGAAYAMGARATTASKAPRTPQHPPPVGSLPLVLAFDMAAFEPSGTGDGIVRGTGMGPNVPLLPKLVLQRLGKDDLLVNVTVWNVGDSPTRVFPMGIDRYQFDFVGASGDTLLIYKLRPGSLPTPQESDYGLLHPMSYLGGQFLFRSFYSRTKDHAPVKVRVEFFPPNVPRPRPVVRSGWANVP